MEKIVKSNSVHTAYYMDMFLVINWHGHHTLSFNRAFE